jgi:hypothetical protein
MYVIINTGVVLGAVETVENAASLYRTSIGERVFNNRSVDKRGSCGKMKFVANGS